MTKTKPQDLALAMGRFSKRFSYSYNRGYIDGKANLPFAPTGPYLDYLDGYNAGQEASDRNPRKESK